MSFYLSSCKKDTEKKAPIPTFNIEIDSITSNSAVCIITITNVKDTTLWKGVHLSMNSDFSISHYDYSGGEGLGNFKVKLINLVPNTVFYVRAYAFNYNNSSYSQTISFTTSPQISTALISEITQTAAKSGGNFYNNGNVNILYKGICWSANQNPTISNDKINLGSGTTDFTCTMTGLLSNTHYYIRAYVINSEDTIYGQQKTFVTYSNDVIYDTDNNIYNKIKIGYQVWMKEDLRVTHYRNGDLIGTIDLSDDIRNESVPKYQWAYQDNDSNISKLSRLYTWYALTDNRGVCPLGWHLPTNAEWDLLTSYLGGDLVAGGRMKESGSIHWGEYNTESNNESGFTALPEAFRRYDGYFWTSASSVEYWSATENDSEDAWIRQLESHVPYLESRSDTKKSGYSCRCIKD